MLNGFLRQATASQSVLIGPFIDDTDFKTTETGLTIALSSIKLSKNGLATSDLNSGSVTHRTNGMYQITFNLTDTDTVGELALTCSVSGALPVYAKFRVVEESIFDALYSAGSGFPTNWSSLGISVGGAINTVTTVTQMAGTIQTLDALDTAQDAQHATTQSDAAAIKAVTDQFVFTVSNQVDANALTTSGGDATEAKQDVIITSLAAKTRIATNPIKPDRLEWIRGDSYTVLWDFGESIDGYAVDFTIRDAELDTVIHTSSQAAASGQVATVVIINTQSELFTLGTHKFDVQAKLGTDTKTQTGTVLIKEDQTRA